MHALPVVCALPLTIDTYLVKIWFKLPLPFSICQTLQQSCIQTIFCHNESSPLEEIEA